MGGIMAMLMAAMKPEMVKVMIINDIGPEIAKSGLDRLKEYMGRSVPVKNWDEAIQQTALINEIAFPEADEQFWLQFAKRLYREDDKGVPVLAYDLNIAVPLLADGENSDAPDLWPVYAQILEKPMLLIRGALSDIIDVECVQRMLQMKPGLEILEIPNVGHAPLLNEADVDTAILSFLSNNS